MIGDPEHYLEVSNRRINFIPELIKRAEIRKSKSEEEISQLNEELAALPAKIKQLENEVAVFRAQKAAALAKKISDEQIAKAAQEAERARVIEAEQLKVKEQKRLEEEAFLAKKRAEEEAADAIVFRVQTALALPEESAAEKHRKIAELKELNRLGFITESIFKYVFERLTK